MAFYSSNSPLTKQHNYNSQGPVGSSVENQPFSLGTAKFQSYLLCKKPKVAPLQILACVFCHWQLLVVIDKLPFHEENCSSTTGRVIESHKAACTCFVIGFKFTNIFSTGLSSLLLLKPGPCTLFCLLILFHKGQTTVLLQARWKDHISAQAEVQWAWIHEAL